MAGSSKAHNTLSGHWLTTLRVHLRGKPCQVFMADVKVHVETAGEVFYYPDVGVSCDKRDPDPYLLRYPEVVLEVLSAAIEQIDRREKFLACTQCKTLQEYVWVAQGPDGGDGISPGTEMAGGGVGPARGPAAAGFTPGQPAAQCSV